jgi:hypothetical protein
MYSYVHELNESSNYHPEFFNLSGTQTLLLQYNPAKTVAVSLASSELSYTHLILQADSTLRLAPHNTHVCLICELQ